MGLLTVYLWVLSFLLHAASPEQVVSETSCIWVHVEVLFISYFVVPQWLLWLLSTHPLTQVRRNKGRRLGWCLHQGIRELLRHSWNLFITLTWTAAQDEIFSGLVVRKGEFELCSTNTQGRKRSQGWNEFEWASLCYFSQQGCCKTSVIPLQCSDLHSRYQTIAGSGQKDYTWDGYLGGSYMHFLADYEIWKWINSCVG